MTTVPASASPAVPEASPLVTRADLLTRDALASPYPLYRRLREQDALHWSRPDAWRTLTRYDDVSAALRDPRLSSERTQTYFRRIYTNGLSSDVREELRWFAEFRGSMLLYRDPPDHTRLRRIVQQRFTPRAVERLRPRITQIVRELLAPLAGGGEFDIVSGLAHPLPTIVMAELLGVREDEHARLREWCDDLAATVGASDTSRERFERARRGMPASLGFLRGILDDHRRCPRHDLVDLLLAAEARGETGGEIELVGYCALLLIAGLETTTNLIGNAVHALLRHPEQLALLRAEPGLLGAAVEELLRYDSPVQMTARVASEAFELNGKPIRRGQLVECWLGAANRDPERFAEPDQLDLRRGDNRHLAFGQGIHFCLGAPLARLEAGIALSELLRAAPRLALAGERLAWQEGLMFRGLRRLPVRLD